MDLHNKNVVVTGASQGIGEKVAESFAAAGAKVLAIARSEAKLAALAERVNGHYVVADLSVAEDIDGLVDSCIDRLGHIDVWVNNAGVETSDAFVNTARNDVRHLSRLNFEAPMLLTHDVTRHMLARGAGHVVQMSSLAGAMPFPGLTAYAGAKAGLTNFTESLRLELAQTEVNFTVAAPGPVQTPMWDRLDTGTSYQAPALKRFRQLGFLPKLDPEAVAAATVNAVRKNKRFVRIPARFGIYHALNNAPRRLVEGALLGVKMPIATPS